MKIEAQGLCKVFSRIVDGEKKKSGRKEDFFAVDHVDLCAREREILGVLGPNGAGKTTLLRMLGMLLSPTEGRVRLLDEKAGTIEDLVQMKRSIGYLSENTKLYGRLSVRELLHILGRIYDLTEEEEEQRIAQIISVLGMEGFADNRIERLSTGQTQRANIARCLIHSPEVYIFDEPTLGLDILSSEAIVDFMKQEKGRGKSVLYSTHYMEEAQYLCDRVVMLYRGRIIADDTPAELMGQTGSDNLRECFRVFMSKCGDREEKDA